MECWIYRGSRRAETYLYLAAPDDTSRVPGALLEALGRLDLVMTLRLHSGRRLARADVERVMHELETRGFFVQLPPADAPVDRPAQ